MTSNQYRHLFFFKDYLKFTVLSLWRHAPVRRTGTFSFAYKITSVLNSEKINDLKSVPEPIFLTKKAQEIYIILALAICMRVIFLEE